MSTGQTLLNEIEECKRWIEVEKYFQVFLT
jgi:hypothetical protein